MLFAESSGFSSRANRPSGRSASSFVSSIYGVNAARICSRVVMTQSNFQASIPQTQDELRDRFFAKGLKKKLTTQYVCEVTEPWVLGLDHWKNPVEVRKEKYKDRKTGK